MALPNQPKYYYHPLDLEALLAFTQWWQPIEAASRDALTTWLIPAHTEITYLRAENQRLKNTIQQIQPTVTPLTPVPPPDPTPFEPSQMSVLPPETQPGNVAQPTLWEDRA